MSLYKRFLGSFPLGIRLKCDLPLETFVYFSIPTGLRYRSWSFVTYLYSMQTTYILLFYGVNWLICILNEFTDIITVTREQRWGRSDVWGARLTPAPSSVTASCTPTWTWTFWTGNLWWSRRCPARTAWRTRGGNAYFFNTI
jgi:hypothetical protein